MRRRCLTTIRSRPIRACATGAIIGSKSRKRTRRRCRERAGSGKIAAAAAGDRRLRHPSDPQVAGALRPYLSERWQEHAKTFGAHVRQGLIGQLTHPRMRRRASAPMPIRRTAARPAPISPLMRKQHLDPQRRRDRHAGRARARRHGRAESGFRRRAVARGQRLADRGVGEAGAAPEAPASWCRRKIRRPAVAEIERCAPEFRVPPDHHVAAHVRAARPPALLADLRGRAKLPACRSGCIRPAPAAVIRRPARAGRPTTCRSTTRSRPACRA